MTKEYKETEKAVFGEDFKNFCRKEFQNNIKDLETARLKYIGICILLLVIIISSFILEFSGATPGDTGITETIITIIIGAGAIILYIWFLHTAAKLYKTDAKKIILAKLLSFTGDFQRTSGDDKEYTKKLKLFKPFEDYYCDDKITGTYRLLKTTVTEIKLKDNHGNKIFGGITVKIPYQKKIEGITVILKNKTDYKPAETEKLNLNDEEFDKYYDVYTTDAVEARYTINSRFMRRMTQYAKYGLADNISFSFEQGFFNIAVESKKDWFEIPFLKPAGKIENYRAIIFEIITIMKIIDAVCPDTKIGL